MYRGIYTPLSFENEIDVFALPHNFPIFAAKLEAADAEWLEMRREIVALTDELTEAFRDLDILGIRSELHADVNAISLILSIDKGQFVQDLADGMQTLLFDMQSRFDPDKKWNVASKVTLQHDANNENRKIVKAEVKSVTPPIESGGAIYTDGQGKMLAVKDAVKQMRLFEKSETETSEAA